MGKHAFWMASFEYVAKCLDVTMRHLHLPLLLHGQMEHWCLKTYYILPALRKPT